MSHPHNPNSSLQIAHCNYLGSSAVHVGVDPGLSGAIAFYDALSGELHVIDMPTRQIVRNGKKRRQIDAVELGRALDLYTSGRFVHAYVEQVGAMPNQGVTSMFSFGRACGVVDGELGALLIEPVYVLPRVWQAAVGIPPKADKAEHRAAAQRIWGFHHEYKFQRVKDDGRADAALILHYGLTTQEK